MNKFKNAVIAMKSQYALLKEHWFLGGFVVAAVATGAIAASTFVEKAVVDYFPDYFQNEANEILENQNRNFDDLKETLSELKSKINTDEGTKVLSKLTEQVGSAREENLQLSLLLNAITEENRNLRNRMERVAGIDAGADFFVLENGGIKVGKSLVFGVSRVFASGHEVRVNVSSNEGNGQADLKAGASISAVDSDGSVCQFSYLGKSGDALRFAKSCKMPHQAALSSKT